VDWRLRLSFWGATDMYVSRGMGAPYEPLTPLLRPVPIIRFRRPVEPLMRPRGFGRFRGLGDAQSTCPPGYWNANLGVCCGQPGTPASMDPCSILNNPGFIAQQNQEVAQDVASIPASSYEGQTLQALLGVPLNIGNDAVKCQSNPGATFVDEAGVTITCPSASHTDLTTGGQPMSTFSTAQLAQLLNQQYGGASPTTIGNRPFEPLTPLAQPGGSGGAGGGSSFPVSVRLVNNSGGSNSSFNVGDAWSIIVTGPPNAAVVAGATQNGSSLGSSPQGTIGSNGQLTITGTMSAAQVGNWTESWTVGGKSAGSLSFSVAAPSGGSGGGNTGGSGGGGGNAGGGNTGGNAGGGLNLSSLLTGTAFSIGSVAVPVWGVAAAVLAGFFLMGGKR
jgi:hypothetical protein